jgi:hypothetical protein
VTHEEKGFDEIFGCSPKESLIVALTGNVRVVPFMLQHNPQLLKKKKGLNPKKIV